MNVLLCLIDEWPISNRRSPVLARQHAKVTPTSHKPDPFHQPPAGKWRIRRKFNSWSRSLPLSLSLSLPLASLTAAPAGPPRSPSAARRLPLFTSRRGLNIDTDSPPANRSQRRRPAPTPSRQWEEAGGRGRGGAAAGAGCH